MYSNHDESYYIIYTVYISERYHVLQQKQQCSTVSQVIFTLPLTPLSSMLKLFELELLAFFSIEGHATVNLDRNFEVRGRVEKLESLVGCFSSRTRYVT